MKNIPLLVVGLAMVWGSAVWADSAEPEPISVDLSYLGLDCGPGQMQYGYAYGYGRPSSVEDTPFIAAVQKQAKNEVHVVYNPSFPDRMLSAVETVEREAKRFYFDINADGKLSDEEVFEPVVNQQGPNWKEFSFVTSDFSLTSKKGGEIPFRAKLGVNFYGTQDRPSCMWSPACVLEGTAQIGDKKQRLMLFVGSLEGDYFEYGRSRYALLDPEKEYQYPTQSRLSSLIFYEGAFYKLKFEGSFEEQGSLRAILVRDTSPTGTLAVELQGQEKLGAKISYANVDGKSDPTVHFKIQASQEFPIGRYVLQNGQFQFGLENNFNWQVGFSEGPDFSIEDGKTVTLKLGDPEMTVRSVDENKRYTSEVQDLDRFSSNSRIYISPMVSGADGETYTRFQKTQGILGALSRRFSDVKPHLIIKGPSGDNLVDQDLEYG